MLWLALTLWAVLAYGLVWLLRRPHPEDDNRDTVALPPVAADVVCSACAAAAGPHAPHSRRCGGICLCRVSAPGRGGVWPLLCRRCGGRRLDLTRPDPIINQPEAS